MGTMDGWNTRRRRQAERSKEWHDAVFAAGKTEGAKEERGRIKAELMDSIRSKRLPMDHPEGSYYIEESDLRTELDRICPEEG